MTDEPRRRIPPWVTQVGTFAVVGGLAFLVDVAVLQLALDAGASKYSGRIVSMAVSIVFTWLLNRRLTFATAAPPSWREFGAYGLQSLAGAAVNYAIYAGVVTFGGPVIVGQALGTGVAAVFNFIRYRAILGR